MKTTFFGISNPSKENVPRTMVINRPPPDIIEHVQALVEKGLAERGDFMEQGFLHYMN
jgi:hypothetical protein